MKQHETICKTIVHQASGMFDPSQVLSIIDDTDVMLLESADVHTKLGEKSMLFLDCALKVESRSGVVEITALLTDAKPLLAMLAQHFHDVVRLSSDDVLTLQFAPLFHHLDLIKKMRATSALNVLRTIMALVKPKDVAHHKHTMLAGTLSYDFLDHFEELPLATKDIHHYPDYLFYMPLTIVVLDHKTKSHEFIAHDLGLGLADKRLHHARHLVEKSQKSSLMSDMIRTSAQNDFKNLSCQKQLMQKVKVDISDEDFGRLVATCKEYIASGDVYQIVPSRTFFMPIDNPLRGYYALRMINPSPYMFYMKNKDFTLLGASPETFIKVDKDGKRVSIRPIAGTRRRGFNDDGSIDEELDSREQASLCLDEKELAEHMMLVDLARNDIASVCKPKSRRIKRMLAVDRFSHVMHLVSEVEGVLLPDFDALSAYQASMNMGTLMGAPKVRAATLLRKLEATKRGFYGGAVGYIDGMGNMDTSIIIRSALVHDKTAYVRAGCGVVSDSNIQFEVQETLNKAEATLRALALAGL